MGLGGVSFTNKSSTVLTKPLNFQRVCIDAIRAIDREGWTVPAMLQTAFTYFVFRLVALIIGYRNIRSCRDIQRHNGLVENISHTVPIALHCNQLESLLNWVRINK
jgi:hypothetical protein